MFTKITHTLKKWPKTSVAIALVIMGLIALIALLTRPSEPEYITEFVVQGNLEQKVETTAEIISERDLKLQFPLTGVIDRVLVEEGDTVKAGQELARLRSSGLQADVNSAAASVAQAKADLQNLEEGTREEQLAVTRAAVTNKEAAVRSAEQSLEAAKRSLEQAQVKREALGSETSTNLQGAVDSVRSSVSSQLANLLSSTQTFSSLLDDLKLRDVLVRYEPSLLRTWESTIQTYEQEVLRQDTTFASITSYTEAVSALEAIYQTASRMSDFYARAALEVSSLPVTSTFTQGTRDSIRNSMLNLQSSTQGTLTGIDANLQSLRNTPTSIETRIAAEEAAVLSAQNAVRAAETQLLTARTTLEIEQANLLLQEAGSRPGDIAAARARLNQAYASYQRAAERFNDTIIRAPIDGIVTKVNLKAGELLSTSFASESAISMLGNAAYRVELYVPEIDIPNVRIGQTGSIVLDSYPEQEFGLTLSEVEPTATIVDGVPKYRAVLDFVSTVDQSLLKIGMTGDAEILTNQSAGALQIPARAVRRNEAGREVVDVLQPDRTIKTVEIRTGLEGVGGQLEVLTGLQAGQEIIILQR